MEKPIAPCLTCGHRTPECHATCSGYAEFIEKQTEYKKIVSEEKIKDYHERGKWDKNRKDSWAKLKGLKR